MRSARQSGAASAAVALLLLADAAAASPAPLRTWKTLRTACCDVTFDADVEEKGRHVAAIVDDIVASLEELLDSPLKERVHIVLSDATDSPNGFAQPIPYNQINLFAVNPDGNDELARNEDWLRMLLTHEMLHIIHIDTVHGIPTLVNAILGKWWLPNFVLPDWLLEGLATYAETALTAGGRLRSDRWMSRLRVAAVEGDLWRLDDVSNYSRRPPAGDASRLYGGYFLLWLANRLGSDEYMARFNHEYASRPIPYGIHRSFEASAGVDLDAAWREFLADVRADAFRRVLEIEARGGLTKTRRLTRTGGNYTAPDFSPEGDLLFALNPLQGRSGVYRVRGLPEAAPVVEPVFRSNGSAHAEALGGGDVLVSMGEWWWMHWAFRDLFLVEPGGTPRRVTDGARVRTPALFSDGRRALAEARSGASSAVVEVDLETGRTRDVVRYDNGTIAFTPVPSPDGRRFVYSKLPRGGTRDLVERDLATGEERYLTRDAAEDADPCWTPDGRWVVFTSDRDGALNLYAWNRADERVVRVTDVIGAATAPEVTPDGKAVVFVMQHLDGEDLYAATLDLENAPLAEPSVLPVEDVPPAPVPEPVTAEADPYNPLPTLLPRNWLPVFEGGSGIPNQWGIAVEGNDVVGQYAWSFDGRWNLEQQRPDLQASLRFADWWFPLSLSARHRTQLGQGVVTDENGEPADFPELIYTASANFTVPVRRWLRSHSFRFGYRRQWNVPEDASFSGVADQGRIRRPSPSNIGAVTFTWSYSSDERYRDSVSGERGWDATVRTRVANAWTFSELDLYEVTYDVRAFQPVPGLRNHALAVYLQGGIGIGDRQRRANYYLGGFRDRSIVQDLVDGPRYGAGYLRGYPSAVDVGDSYLLGTLEYRFPIWEVERGIGSLPLFLSRVHGAVYGDLGDAFDGVFQPRRLRAGVGVEARAQIIIGYKGLLYLRTGFARGLMPGGIEQPYLVMGVPY